MKSRRGRLNIIKFVDEDVVHKIGVVPEEARPYRLKVEAWALSRARQKGINTPRVLDYYRDNKGQEVLVLEKISGRHLSLQRSRENAECMCNVGSQMLLLDDATIDYGWIDPDSFTGTTESWDLFISSYLYRYGSRLVQRGVIDKVLLEEICRRGEDIDLEISSPSLVNRDLKPSNVIKDNDGKVWIIDWEDVILGDPLYDVAIFGAKYGHGFLWENLIRGFGLDVSTPKYFLYEAIGLIGIIDFYYNNKISFRRRPQQLYGLVSMLSTL